MDSVNVTLDVNLFVMVAVIIVYLGAVAFLSWLGRIKSRGDDFASGGRNIPSAVMALSYGAAFISTSAIVGFGGMAAEIGMSLIWLAGANIFFGIFLAFAVFGKRTRAVGLTLDAHTFPEFLPFIRYFTAAVMIVSMPLYAAAVLIGAARILESLLGVPYEYALAAFSLLVAVYVLIGGLRGVMYTDALQGTLMIAGMLFLLVAMFIKLGGPDERACSSRIGGSRSSGMALRSESFFPGVVDALLFVGLRRRCRRVGSAAFGGALSYRQNLR